MAEKENKYIGAIGRRKTATAQVRITPSKSRKIAINDRPLEEYFPVSEYQKKVNAPFDTAELDIEFTVTVVVKGGGNSAQAEAVRHGISRALIEYKEELRIPLKKSGFLKRDPRSKERKKPGLRKARKAPQWSKR